MASSPREFTLLLSSLWFTVWDRDHTILATRRERLTTGSLIDLTQGEHISHLTVNIIVDMTNDADRRTFAFDTATASLLNQGRPSTTLHPTT